MNPASQSKVVYPAKPHLSCLTDAKTSNIKQGENLNPISKPHHTDLVVTFKIDSPENITVKKANKFIAVNYPSLQRGINFDGAGLQIIFEVVSKENNKHHYVLSSVRGTAETTAMGGKLDFELEKKQSVKDMLENIAARRLKDLASSMNNHNAKALDKIRALLTANKGVFDQYYTAHTATWPGGGMHVITGSIRIPITQDDLNNLIDMLQGSTDFIRNLSKFVSQASAGYQLSDGDSAKQSTDLDGHEVFNDLALTALARENGSIIHSALH